MRRIGTSTCIIKGNQILIGQRGPACKRGHGCYSLPGGKLEDNEDIISSAAREVKEETGLTVIYPSRHFELCSFAATDHYPDNKLTLWFYAFYISGTPTNNEPNKCLGWTWMTIDQIATTAPDTLNNNSEQYYWLPLPLLKHHLQHILKHPIL